MLQIDKAIASITGIYGHYNAIEKKLETTQKRGDAKEKKARILRALLIEAEKKLPVDLDSDLRERIADALHCKFRNFRIEHLTSGKNKIIIKVSKSLVLTDGAERAQAPSS